MLPEQIRIVHSEGVDVKIFTPQLLCTENCEAVEDFRSIHAKGPFKYKLDSMWSRASKGLSKCIVCYLHSKADVFFIRRQGRKGFARSDASA
jgi:hypothetical protein